MTSKSTAERIRDGLHCLLGLGANVEVYVEHDIIYAGCGPAKDDSNETKKSMIANGWIMSDEYDCWALFT